MIRQIAICLAAALLATAAQAQTTSTAQPAQPQRPRPGTITDTPASGRITDVPVVPQTPAAQPPATQATAPAGAPATGDRIERFEAVGNKTVATDTIRVYLGVNPGDVYDPGVLQRNFANLWQTGLFDDIRLETERGERGVIVRAVVKERPRIGSVEYRGNKELQTNKITEALEKEKIDIHIGNTIEQTLIRRAAEAIKRAYVENGFEDPSVETSTEDLNEPGEKKIVFHINEGIKAKVASIDFVGNKRFSSRKLRSVMKEVKPNNLITWLRKKNLYIPSKLDEDLENIKNYYQDYGYFDVSFGDPKVVTVGRNTKKPRVKLVIPVNEGGVFKFGEVSVTGNTIFTNQQIIGDWPIKKGETLRRKPIQTRADAFGDAYRMRGYIYAYVSPEYVKRDATTMDVHMQVYEGDPFRLGRLEFQGNTTTKDKVLRREIFLDEGQLMDMETFKQSIYKLGQLGYFKVTENPDMKVNPDSKTVDITVKGTEEGKNDIQFGGGYSEGGGFFLQTQFSTRNFLGEGENLGLSYQKGNRTNFFSLSYGDPWFMDTPNSLSVSLFKRDTKYPASIGYEDSGTGGSIGYGYRLHRFDTFSLYYGLERSRIHYETNVAPDPNGNVPISSVTDYRYRSSTIAPAYNFDSLDNPFDATRGKRLSLTAAYSGGPLGGTVHALKPTIMATKFFRISRRSSFSINTQFGRIFPLDKKCSNSRAELIERNDRLCVPETERFLVGGENSVRGFQAYTLGPLEDYAGQLRPAGGYKYHVVNLEYITKISDPLRFVLFADAGQGYSYAEKWDLAKTRYTAGAELRIFLPVFQFPLRFIYSYNIKPEKTDRFETVQFTIGNTY